MPIMLYGLEVTHLKQSTCTMLNLVNRAVYKISRIFDINGIQQILDFLESSTLIACEGRVQCFFKKDSYSVTCCFKFIDSAVCLIVCDCSCAVL